jgi:hypothetical protein
MRWHAVLLVGAVQSLVWSADTPIPGRPETVERLDNGQVMVSWGAIGPWTRSRPEEIAAEQARFRAFFHERVNREIIKRLFGDMADIGAERADVAIADLNRQWATQERPTDIPTKTTESSRSEPVGDHWGRLAWPVRSVMQIVYYDDRDPAQRSWLVERARRYSDDHHYFHIAVAWRNRADLKGFMQLHPGLGIAALGDATAKQLGVQRLPAVLDFPDEQSLRVREGLDPAEVARMERETTERRAAGSASAAR